MKILKEAKEDLPISFLTNFVSKSWDQVGELKEEIKAINKSFKGTAKVEKVLQDLVDSYLICIGQVELYLEKQDYLEYPETKVEESLTEDLDKEQTIIIDNGESTEEIADEMKDIDFAGDIDIKPILIDDDEIAIDAVKMSQNDENIEIELVPEEQAEATESFDYFCDFDEPDLSEKPLTDADLYGNK